MKAVCTVYDKPWLRFTPRHCEQFLHLGLEEDVYPYGVVVAGLAWGWYVLFFDGVWKILPECGFFLEDGAVSDEAKDGRAAIVIQDWRHPASGSVYKKARILTDRSRKRPFVFEKGLWRGACLRCGTCCSVPRRSTGQPCEYLEFTEELQ